MNKKIKIFLVLLLFIIIFAPFKSTYAWAYRYAAVPYNFTTATQGTYQISSSKSYNFGRYPFYIHEAYSEQGTHQGYCLHAGKSIDFTQDNQSTLEHHSGFEGIKSAGSDLTETQKELLQNILTSGYSTPELMSIVQVVTNGAGSTTCRDKTTCKKVLATQILVWEVMERGRTNYNYNPNNISNNTYAFVSTDAELKKIYEEILDSARDLSSEGSVPDTFGKTFNLTWNDSTQRYESESIYVGGYGIDAALLPSGVTVSDKTNNSYKIYSTKELSSPTAIKFNLVKGSSGTLYSTFQWFRFTSGACSNSKCQDVVLGKYRKVITKEINVVTETGKFYITKDTVTSENGTLKEIKGAKFNVYKCNSTTSCDTNNVVYSIDLTSNAKSNVYEIKKSGYYMFREVSTPSGYETIPDFYVYFSISNGVTTAKPSDTTYVKVDSNNANSLHLAIINESKKFSIKKVDGSTSKTIAGASFKIKDSKGNYLKFKKELGVYNYDANGTIDTIVDSSKSEYNLALLPIGEYVIEEVNVPYPYSISGSSSQRETKIKIDSNYDLCVYNYTTNKYERSSTASVTIKNYKTVVSMIKKGKNNTKLSGVVFELYDSNKKNQINLIKTSDGVYQYPENGVGSPVQLITNSSGQITINYLPVGTYYMKEVKAADGYVIDSTVEWKEIKVSITRDGQSSPLKVFEWPNAKGEFCFYKIDEDGNYLTDGKFKIQYYDTSTSKYTDIPLIYNEKNNNYTIDTTYKSDIYTFSPLKNGETCFVDVNAKGKYKIVEIEAPEGFQISSMDDAEANFEVNENGYVIGNTTIINKKITTGDGSEAQAELIINIQTGQTIVRYGLIIVSIVVAIIGLLFLNKKLSKK